jgi:hypothetical protein
MEYQAYMAVPVIDLIYFIKTLYITYYKNQRVSNHFLYFAFTIGESSSITCVHVRRAPLR